jgi:hypothetical protein
MPKFFQEGKQLKRWHPNGRAVVVDEFETEEEASQEWLERTYESDYQTRDGFFDDYEDMEEMYRNAADIMELDVEVVKSIMHHHDIIWREMSRRKAEERMEKVNQVIANARGQITKALRRALDAVEYGHDYMWGSSNNRELCTKEYYTKEFIETIERLRREEMRQGRMKFLRTEFRDMGAMIMVDGQPNFVIGADPLIDEILASADANGEQHITDEERTQAVVAFGLKKEECWQVNRTGNHLYAFLTPEGTRKYRGY